MTTWLKRQAVCNLMPAIFALFVAGPIVWLLFDRQPVLTETNLRIEPSVVAAGTATDIKWTVILHRKNCSGLVDQRFIDSANQIFSFSIEPSVFHDDFEDGDYVKEVSVPLGMAPGPARYESRISRWCNPLQKWFWQMRDPLRVAKFTVTGTPAR